MRAQFLNFSLAVFAALSLALVSGCATKSSGSGSVSGGDGEVVYGENSSGATSGGGIGLGTLQRVQFPFDSSRLSDSAREKLQQNANTIKSNKSMKVLVEGHCDERGSNEYNIALGERRARSVIDYLVNLGVSRRSLEMKSWGEERPLNPGRSDSAYAQNRRAEFVILAK